MGLTLNLFSIIGIIMLMGLATKNSILLVDFTNQLRGQGVARDDALLRAARVRLRPILMTSISTILGVLPALLGLGSGTETRQPLAAAVVGGMLTSTLLTLLVVPTAYTIVDDAGRVLLNWARLWPRSPRYAARAT
jgi:HAE1 family hydrophobic/amphiphilic exporter-1